jgi:hypothetical protein
MTQPTIHIPEQPEGRPATEQEIADILGQYTALDGTSYLDMWRDSQDEDGDQ